MQEGGREGGRGRRRRREGNGDADIARRKVGAGLLHQPSVWHHQPPVESWRHREPDRAAMTKMTKIGGGKKTAGISWDLPSEQNQEIKNYAYNKLQNYLDRQSAHTRPERKAPSHSWRPSSSSLFLFAADLLLSPLIDSKWNLPTSFKRNNANEKKNNPNVLSGSGECGRSSDCADHDITPGAEHSNHFHDSQRERWTPLELIIMFCIRWTSKPVCIYADHIILFKRQPWKI